MPSATEQPNEQAMASDVIARGADEGGEQPRPQPTPSRGGGFFHIYKSGQGYWTRMGTAAGSALIIIMSTVFLFEHLPSWLQGVFERQLLPTATEAERGAMVAHATILAKNTTFCVCVVFIAISGILVHWFMNKPSTADFLIATDSEMKKVNWTSRKELLGSTRVVILFMFLIATLLFTIDIVFGYVFYWLTILKNRPF